MNLLFVCSQNYLRSPTAADLFATRPGVVTRSAGTDMHAVKSITADDIAWADMVFAMEQKHKKRLVDRFPDLCRTRAIYVLGIPDQYERDDPQLIDLLRRRVEPLLATTECK